MVTGHDMFSGKGDKSQEHYKRPAFVWERSIPLAMVIGPGHWLGSALLTFHSGGLPG